MRLLFTPSINKNIAKTGMGVNCNFMRNKKERQRVMALTEIHKLYKIKYNLMYYVYITWRDVWSR